MTTTNTPPSRVAAAEPDLPAGERQGMLAAAVVFLGSLTAIGCLGLLLLAMLKGGAL